MFRHCNRLSSGYTHFVRYIKWNTRNSFLCRTETAVAHSSIFHFSSPAWVKNNRSNNSKNTVDGGDSGQSVCYCFALIYSDFGRSRWKGCLLIEAGLSRFTVSGTVSIGAHLSGWYSPQTDGRTDGSSLHIKCLFLFRKERLMFELPSDDKASTWQENVYLGTAQ